MVEEDRYRSNGPRTRAVARNTSAAECQRGQSSRDRRSGHRQQSKYHQETTRELQNEANYRGWPSMTSFRQIEANRRNARKSTGPITEEGKERSRCNAVRHGLTAETVIGALEDADDYKAFEAAVIADYDVQSAVERELVLQLASLLWRLRRATTMETGLFDIQADQLSGFRQACRVRSDSQEVVYAAMVGRAHSISFDQVPISSGNTDGTSSGQKSVDDVVDPTADLTRCFLRLANLPSYPLDRLSRYEATLWRQAGRVLFALDALGRRRPQERGRRFRNGERPEPPT
jgi:hypothetical protein